MKFNRQLFGLSLFLVILILASAPNKIWAADKGVPLLFPAMLNNIQPLPQKFEYSLRDAYRFLLGNRIIDTSQFEFEIRPTSSAAEVDIRWPENLFETGILTVLSPSGVSVWSAKLNESQNVYTISNANPLVTKLLSLSFFKFCISQYETNTGMEVCSPELVAKGSGSKIRIESKPYPNKPRIQINGRSVTPHGIVFLNDEKESLSFRAIAASGAEFKMDTRSINLEFIDVTDVNDSLMNITIKGPFPLPPSQYKIVKNDVWTVTLKKDRALIYIAGEGKVPLRQEFVVQGALPTEANRLYLEKSSPTHAYGSSLELRGWNPEQGLPQASDGSSEVAVTGNRFSWSLKNLTVAQDRISTIQILNGKDVFTAGYSFSRSYANRLELLGGLNTYKSNIYVGGEAQMWFESLPFLSRLSQQKFGLGLIYNQDIVGNLKAILTEFDLYWRLKPGLQLIDPGFYFGIGIQNLTFNSKSLQTTAPFVGWMGQSFNILKYFSWQEFNIKQSLKATTGDFQIKSRTEFKWKLYHALPDKSRIRYSAGFYTQDGTQKASGALIETAWVIAF